MKSYIAIISLLVLFLMSNSAPAQTSASASAPVSAGAIVDECADCQSVKSSRVFLVDSADRKFGFEMNFFEALVKNTGKEQVSSAKEWKAQIYIYSYGKSLQYLAARETSPMVEREQFRFIVNGVGGRKDLKIGSKNYFFLRESYKDGNLFSFSSFFPQMKDGKITDENGAEVEGLLGELIISDVSLEALQGLNSAKSLEIKAGGEKFALGHDHLEEIKEMAKAFAAQK